MKAIRPNLRRAISIIAKDFEKDFDLNSEDLLALVLLTEPVQSAIRRQAQIINDLLGDETK